MQRFIETHTNEHFDVLVIGGGITGASVAYEAATRGLKVALLEKKDFSWATSAATSKMIHGGLRYLVNGEICWCASRCASAGCWKISLPISFILRL